MHKKLGLKCGLEIHQQLEGTKLFCSCPTLLRDDAPHFSVRRKLRASAGESGVVDAAAAAEQQRNRMFVYEGYKDTTCLVELDAQPPKEISTNALYTGLQFSHAVGAQVPAVVQVMRKTVVDGSNTSGFQRTVLLGRHGNIETSEGNVRVSNITIEEDSCKNIVDTENGRVYRMDRLGVPLIEIGTEPDIKSPQQCQEAAKKIGMILRSLPGIKRGLGTIRQDVNVSIEGGERIEIKGAQDLRMIPTLVELEAKRQEELLKIKNELKGKKLDVLVIVDLTSELKDSPSKMIQKSVSSKGKVLGTILKGFKGMIGRELQPNYRLGTEFSWRAKIKAGVGGIFHSDELPNYGITEDDVAKVRDVLKCAEQDAFILVADKEEKARRALMAVHERVGELWKGIPKEVRKANDDGTTSYMRPISGAARMYPETDVPLVVLKGREVELPELLDAKIERYQKEYGMARDLAEHIAKGDKVMLFEETVSKYAQIKPAFIADTLTSTVLEIKRVHNEEPEKVTDEQWRKVFLYLSQDLIHKDIIIDVLLDMIKGVFDLKKYEGLSTEELHRVIISVIEKNKGAPQGALMGLCMKALAGKASGQVIARELKVILERGHK
ncbi:Glu-tRNA(Gln) amidotransferase subunit GatE [Candidatus Woesearchaeota archaeon]|nr:Glu-tRNA(Gln) amidotransferase subunit GatE [Candidatus Woesearchaeota archaeon]